MYNGDLSDSRKTATGNVRDKPSPIAANDADHIEHCVHVIVKNLQSIRCESRWEDFIAELDQCDFDLLLICETWRGERDESFITERGHHIYLSGGANHQGVGICTSAHFASQISHMSFHAYSNRICSLHFCMAFRRFRVFSCYFPTAWDADGAVEQMYDVLNLLVDACVEAGDIPIVGGDFNACIGLIDGDDLTLLQHVGPIGMGQRNARGTMLMHWILQNKLYIFNRDGSLQRDESWTCRRAYDGTCVQLDFIIGDAYFTLKKAWQDYCIPIGNDHRCVHCVLSRTQPYKQQHRRKQVLKGWKPIMDESGKPSTFHTFLEAKIVEQDTTTFDAAESLLMSTALATGTCARHKFRFTPSDRLRNLRHRRKQVHDNATRKCLTFQIRRLHRKECRQWKATLLRKYLAHPGLWKELQNTSSYTSKPLHQHPPLDEFAMMLEKLFTGTPEAPVQPNHLTEEPWTLQELMGAVEKLKSNKSGDECGLVAEVFKHIPTNFAAKILRLYNDLLSNGDIPSSWRRTLFTMLAKHRKAALVTEFRPIASVRLFYKIFAYMILHRIQPCLDSHQPEEQHGFRAGRRLEEHLLTANLFLDKTLAANIPVWVLSLDLSKAFDRVDWSALWLALSEHGVSSHMVWILQNLYFGQHGEVTGQGGNSRTFQINAGVRQGCVLSPKMFSSVLHWAMSKWRRWAEGCSFGFDLGDGLPPLLDLRFADDILIFANSPHEIITLLDKLVHFLGDAGLKLNADKTVLITTQAQPPPFLIISRGGVIKVKHKESGHKWLGCMLSAAGSKNASLDIDYHLQSASRAFFANKWILLSRNVSIRNTLKFFDAIVTPIACFGAGPRCIHSADMVKLDINFRRMLRSLVGAPGGICWGDPWHEILHNWNQRVRQMIDACHMKTWAENCVSEQWKFACYIMSLPHERWARRMLHWKPLGRGPVGRPAMKWASKFEQFSRIKRWYDWKEVAADADRWMKAADEFVKFCTK